MNYYILKQDPRIAEQPSVMGAPENMDPLDFIDGKVLEVPSSPLKFSLSPGSSKFRGDVIGGLVTLFHRVFIDELIRLGVNNIQYFPVELEILRRHLFVIAVKNLIAHNLFKLRRS